MKIYIENTYTIRINNGNILNAKGKENIDVEMINTEYIRVTQSIEYYMYRD